jgi:CheY-like chemotaxis protein
MPDGLNDCMDVGKRSAGRAPTVALEIPLAWRRISPTGTDVDVEGMRSATPEGRTALIQVLIIDDSATVRFILRNRLCGTGRFEVVGEAANGRDGIVQASNRKPDIILLDREMPIMDGFQAIPHLVRSSPRSLIIMLSAGAGGGSSRVSAMAAEAIALGAHAYIEKRARPGEVLRRIVEVWDSAAS